MRKQYTIGVTVDGRAIYYSRNGSPIGLPLAFLRDKGIEAACNTLVKRANKGAESIYNRVNRPLTKEPA